MANEFRIKHGLIVTGSSYFSESMFAPNLPDETAPSYYITWRDTDGRFEVTEVSPTTLATTAGCWDYQSDPGVGEWAATPDSTIGNTTTILTIHRTDNTSNDQNALLASIGKGSLLTLYISGNVTTFEVTGINIIMLSNAIYRYEFNVTYTSGNQYSLVGSPEMCLGVAAAAPANQNCINYTMDNSFNVGTGEASFIIDNGSTQSIGTTINDDISTLVLNGTANSNQNTIAFFQGLTPGSFISISQGTYIAHLTFLQSGTSGNNVTVNVELTPGQTGTTFTAGTTINICPSPGI